ncbi:hypothetical protein B0H17DRAFT_1129129 [Mycena rosella]|uniref:Uncharacterized protein n=1 Tax=Mycena rosella TaxID=1033263 RepID=A0AAD7DUN1_MYCRO|nr:hypothetical protein B0H17DRAFT_1129129 [Mycena rosella]
MSQFKIAMQNSGCAILVAVFVICNWFKSSAVFESLLFSNGHTYSQGLPLTGFLKESEKSCSHKHKQKPDLNHPALRVLRLVRTRTSVLIPYIVRGGWQIGHEKIDGLMTPRSAVDPTNRGLPQTIRWSSEIA